MKKMLFTLALLCILSTLAAAQTEKSNILLGGSGTFNADRPTSGSTVFRGILVPRVGYFIANGIALGAAVPLFVYTAPYLREYSAGLNPFIRGYIGGGNLRLLLEARTGLNYYYARYSFIDQEEKGNGFLNYGLGAGAAYFITNQVGLEVMLNYDLVGDDFAPRPVDMMNGLNLNLGFHIYLNRR
jgi:hypothetical protein